MVAKKPGLSQEVIDKIKEDVERWRPSLWMDEGLAADSIDLGPACICGAGERTLRAARALRGNHGVPTGKCERHAEA